LLLVTSFQKIKEAKFFLELLNEYYHDDDKCDYCISAFLHAGYDLIDHTLEEYQIHFGLKIPPLDLKIRSFIEKAKKEKNDVAIDFIKLYLVELRKVYADPVSAPLMIIRNTNTPNHQMLTPHSSYQEDSTGKRIWTKRCFIAYHDIVLGFLREDLEGYIRSKSAFLHKIAKEIDLNIPLLTPPEFDLIYSQASKLLLEEDIREVCKKHLGSLEAFVGAIRTKYPRF
jgi:hypothetical protein